MFRNVNKLAWSMQRYFGSIKAPRNHYDVLGLTPKATQAEIKKAYYKLSLKHHPDRAKGNEDKFREVTSAYEVLGNVKLRRLYDRGVLPKGLSSHHTSESYEAGTHAKSYDPSDFYRKSSTSSGGRSRLPQTGRTQHFNFDDWSKSHYSSSFQHQTKEKQDIRKEEMIKEWKSEQRKVYNVMFIVCTVGALSIMALILSDSSPEKKK